MFPSSSREKEQILYFIILSNREGIIFTELHTLYEKKTGRRYARTTIMTFVDRMEKKGYVRRERIGRNSKVIPLISREEYITKELLGICDVAFGGDAKQMVSFMLESDYLRQRP